MRHLGIISIIVAFGSRLGFPDFAVAANVSNVTQHLQSFFVGWLLGYRLMTGKTQGGVALRTSILMSAFAVLAWFHTRNTGCTGFLPVTVIAFWVSGIRQLPFEGFSKSLAKQAWSLTCLTFFVGFMRDAFGWSGILNYLRVSAVAIIGAFLVHRLLMGLIKSLSAGNSAAGTID